MLFANPIPDVHNAAADFTLGSIRPILVSRFPNIEVAVVMCFTQHYSMLSANFLNTDKYNDICMFSVVDQKGRMKNIDRSKFLEHHESYAVAQSSTESEGNFGYFQHDYDENGFTQIGDYNSDDYSYSLESDDPKFDSDAKESDDALQGGQELTPAYLVTPHNQVPPASFVYSTQVLVTPHKSVVILLFLIKQLMVS